MIDALDIIVRIAAGNMLGTLIGHERQWRAHTASMRANALASLSATLFVIMGAYSFGGPDADPTRVAAQIVLEIGFLGASVIMKQGASISELNTAATLWASAAVGALAGGGLIWVAAVGTAAVILANTLLRPLGHTLDRRLELAGREQGSDVEYTFEVRCAREHEVSVRAIVFETVHCPELTVLSDGATDLPDDLVVITTIVGSRDRDDHQIELAIAEVIPVQEVLGGRLSGSKLSPAD